MFEINFRGSLISRFFENRENRPFPSYPLPLFQNESNSNENEFDLHENGPVGGTYFHMNGFARRRVLKQGQNVTRKWPIKSREN